MAEKKEHKRINLDLVILAVVAVVVLVLYLCSVFDYLLLFKCIDANDVEKIIISGSNEEMSEARVEEFIQIYNSSKYYGKERNFDTTPGCTYYIHLKDGSQITVTEYGHLFMVSTQYGVFHITNDELEAFIEG